MDFSIPERVKSARQSMRRFVDEELIPLEPAVLRDGVEANQAPLQTVRTAAKKLGLWLPQIPRDHGGAGFNLLEFAYLNEALGRSPLGHYAFNCQAPDAGNMEILLEFGTDDQKELFLAPLMRGEVRSCFSMTEPDSPGSNPTQMFTTAIADGDDYVINGRKWFTTAADGAAFAIVMAVTDPDGTNPYTRASQIIVPTDTPGFRLVRNISVMGEEGDGFMSHGEISYDDVRVPKANLLGEEGAGFAIAQTRLGPGRIHHCMRWIGICERAFEAMCTRAATREISPGKMLGTKQLVQGWIAESRAEIDSARWMVLHAAWKIDREGTYSARTEISTIKFYVAGILQKVLDRAIQTHGALGITDDLPLSFWYRHERGARIYDGPDEVHKAVVARRVLKKYGLEAKS
jgi:acyl-CoA dehydrogenase